MKKNIKKMITLKIVLLSFDFVKKIFFTVSCFSCPLLCYYFYVFRTMWSRDRDVILAGRIIDLGWWEIGMGRDGEGGCQFTSNLGPRWTG